MIMQRMNCIDSHAWLMFKCITRACHTCAWDRACMRLSLYHATRSRPERMSTHVRIDMRYMSTNRNTNHHSPKRVVMHASAWNEDAVSRRVLDLLTVPSASASNASPITQPIHIAPATTNIILPKHRANLILFQSM